MAPGLIWQIVRIAVLSAEGTHLGPLPLSSCSYQPNTKLDPTEPLSATVMPIRNPIGQPPRANFSRRELTAERLHWLRAYVAAEILVISMLFSNPKRTHHEGAVDGPESPKRRGAGAFAKWLYQRVPSNTTLERCSMESLSLNILSFSSSSMEILA